MTTYLLSLAAGILVLLVCAGIGAEIAKSQGRDPLVGSVLGFVFGPFGLAVLALGGKPRR